MLEFLNHIDHTLFLFFNGIHSPFFDSVMFKLTKGMVWTPLFLFLLYLVIRQYRWQTLWVLAFVAVMFLASDQLSNLFKEWICRLRPSHEPGLAVHLVNAYKGGTYGFYSGHASNTFSLAVFLTLVLGNRYCWIAFVVFPWALIMCYTRIYLGVHFPGDILAGMIAGSAIGYFFGRLCQFFLYKKRENVKA